MGDTRILKRSIETRTQELLNRARKLAQTSGTTWVEANNAIYGPKGLFMRLFPSAKDRAAFATFTKLSLFLKFTRLQGESQWVLAHGWAKKAEMGWMDRK